MWESVVSSLDWRKNNEYKSDMIAQGQIDKQLTHNISNGTFTSLIAFVALQ